MLPWQGRVSWNPQSFQMILANTTDTTVVFNCPWHPQVVLKKNSLLSSLHNTSNSLEELGTCIHVINIK